MGGRDDDPGSAVEDDLLISDEDSQEDEDGDLETEGGDEHGHGGGHGGAAHARTAHGTGTHPRTPGSGSGNASKRARGKRRAGDGDERRAKTRRACLACQRAHLTCDDKRPCSRCEKRGLADTCTDGFRKKAKYLADIDDDELQSVASTPPLTRRTGSGNNASTTMGASAIPGPTSPPLVQPQPKQQLLSANLLGTQQDFPVLSAGGPSGGQAMAPALPANLFSSDSINLEYAMLSNMLSQQGFQLPATVAPSATTGVAAPIAPAPIRASAGTVAGTPAITRPSSAAPQQPSPYSQVIKPYDYRQGFHYLVHHIKSRMAKPDIMRICRALAHFRPSFMAQIMNLSEEDLVFMEKCFQRTLLEYDKLINCSGTPTVVWRRTGEVELVGKEFSLLTGWSREQLLGQKKTYIYELMDTESAVDYWEKFSLIAFDNSQTSVMTTCTLVSPEGRNVPCAFCFTIKRDIFDVPLAIVGAFLPSFDKM